MVRHFRLNNNVPSRFVYFPVHFEIVEHARIIKRADAELAVVERTIMRNHRGMGQVVEKDLDQAVLDSTNDPDLVPIFGPGRARHARLGNGNARLCVYEKDAVGMLIGLFTKVNIIEMA